MDWNKDDYRTQRVGARPRRRARDELPSVFNYPVLDLSVLKGVWGKTARDVLLGEDVFPESIPEEESASTQRYHAEDQDAVSAIATVSSHPKGGPAARIPPTVQQSSWRQCATYTGTNPIACPPETAMDMAALNKWAHAHADGAFKTMVRVFRSEQHGPGRVMRSTCSWKGSSRADCILLTDEK